MNGEVISEFLVKIGADVDNGSFNSCISAIKQLEGMLKTIKGAAPFLAIGGAMVGIGKAAVDYRNLCQNSLDGYESHGCFPRRYRMDT